MKELRLVYSAPTEKAALIALDRLEENWGKKYSLSIRTWKQNWQHAAMFFKYLIRLEESFIQNILKTRLTLETTHPPLIIELFYPLFHSTT